MSLANCKVQTQDKDLLNSIIASNLINNDIKYLLYEELYITDSSLLNECDFWKIEKEAKIYISKKFYKKVNKLINSIENYIGYLSKKDFKSINEVLTRQYSILKSYCKSKYINYLFDGDKTLIYKIIDHYYNRDINYLKYYISPIGDNALDCMSILFYNPNFKWNDKIMSYIKNKILEFEFEEKINFQNPEETWIMLPYIFCKNFVNDCQI